MQKSEVPLPATFTCPVMSPEEVASLSLDWDTAVADEGRELLACLRDHGVCVVTSTVPAEELSSLEDAFSNDLRELIDRESLGDPAVASAADAVDERGCRAWPGASAIGQKGFAAQHGLPHGRFAWAARSHPRVRAVFTSIFGCEGGETGGGEDGLRVSTDVVFFTPESAPSGQSPKSLWPHVDQNQHDPEVGGLEIYQGVLYIWPSEGEDAATTVVWPGSHRDGPTDPFGRLMRDAAFPALGRNGANYCALSAMQDPDARAALMDGWLRNARRVPVPAGALLLWSSRTVHQGWSGTGRLAQPVCWEPARRQVEGTRRRKLFLAVHGMPSTHWSSRCEVRTALCPRPGLGGPRTARVFASPDRPLHFYAFLGTL